MKTRESGMPDESMWTGFFKPVAVLSSLQLTPDCGEVVEFGCGYGTFTIPAARIVSGTVYAVDIEPEMIQATEAAARTAGLTNVETRMRDFAAHGTGLPDAGVGYAMVFNILHAECPEVSLNEAHRVLKNGGKLGVTHWNYDPTTPRGPSMDIRPRPDQCRAWAEQAGFELLPPGLVDLPPYHYGMVFRKTSAG